MSRLRTWMLSVAGGVAIEGALLALLAAYPPDPPMNLYGILMILSQMPAGLVVAFIGGMTNSGIMATLFVFQTPVWILLVRLLFWFSDRPGRLVCGSHGPV